jgi:hypothetical protein
MTLVTYLPLFRQKLQGSACLLEIKKSYLQLFTNVQAESGVTQALKVQK